MIMEIFSSRKRSQQNIRAQRTRRSLRRRRPRLSVFRSGKHIYAQIIDDAAGRTLVFASDLKLVKPGAKKERRTPLEAARAVGELIAKAALEKKISGVVFDRGGYKYHGRIRALAEAARKAGLQF
ncbi:MAG: 50S ribosomal protein L18 [Candidatus Sungbacteria bacterium]|uniref:Large ribosomal subunit protein uL18 n=1 Tax=Candidatus Sungiibacteriota bacterium TaxID=2750080 RepID=A0A931WNM3_9BACT|nr:50S ribosomal protein L18 [Candidatus Sungbacteria bacterium]